MTASYKMFRFMVKQIARDMMLAMMVIVPFIVGGLFKFGVPVLEEKILAGLGYSGVLKTYYDLFSWLLAMLTGMMFAFIGGLVVLGEVDEGIAKYIIVTPPGERGYLYSRIVLPGIISGIMTAFLVTVFSINRIGFITTAVMVISTALCGIVTAFLVVAISSNKVEGMAVGKLSGLFGITFFVPYFINGWVKYLFVIFPMYHIGLWAQNSNPIHLLPATVLFVAWTAVLYKLFRRKFA